LSRLTLGSDAELVLRESPVPVLLVRAADTAKAQ
jgi:nucleotide-binding universal stress UspA family protein